MKRRGAEIPVGAKVVQVKPDDMHCSTPVAFSVTDLESAWLRGLVIRHRQGWETVTLKVEL